MRKLCLLLSAVLCASPVTAHLGSGMAVVGSETLNLAALPAASSSRPANLTIPPGHRKRLVMSVPFTLARSASEPFATLAAWLTVPTVGGEPWMVGTLTGSGTATAFFEREHYPGRKGLNEFVYDLVRVIDSFNTPASTP